MRLADRRLHYQGITLPFGTKDGKAVCEQIKALYHRHRNLCEYLSGEVEILKPDELEFHAEFGIEPGEDASVVLARLYATILRYLSGVVQISAPEMAAASGLSPEEWLEGVTDTVRPVVPALQQTEHELYKQLREVEGVRSFTTCYLMKDGEPQTDFSQGFGLQIPTEAKELHVRIRQGYFEVEPDFLPSVPGWRHCTRQADTGNPYNRNNRKPVTGACRMPFTVTSSPTIPLWETSRPAIACPKRKGKDKPPLKAI